MRDRLFKPIVYDDDDKHIDAAIAAYERLIEIRRGVNTGWTAAQLRKVSGAHGPESDRLKAAVRRPPTGSTSSGAAGAVTCSGGAAREGKGWA